MFRPCIRFLFAGRLTASAHLDRVLRALTDTTDEWRLDVLGEGPQRHGLESLSWSLGLRDDVHFHGWVSNEEMIAAMRVSHWLVLPSPAEGLSLAVLQACSLGLPVVGADSRGLRSVIDSGVNGMLVSESDTAWRTALHNILSNPEMTVAMRGHVNDVLGDMNAPASTQQNELQTFQSLGHRYGVNAI